MKKHPILYIIATTAAIACTCISFSAGLWICTGSSAIMSIIMIWLQARAWLKHKEAISTERKYSEMVSNKLVGAESELLYLRNLLENAGTAIISATESGHTEWCNKAARDILDGTDIVMPQIMCAASKGEQEIRINNEDYAISGRRISVNNSVRLIITINNISHAIERSKLESWNNLVRVLTHEIMNSMTPIISLSETLCEKAQMPSFTTSDDSSNDIRAGLEIICRRSKGLLRFVENYRKLSKLPVPDMKAFNLHNACLDLPKLFPQPFIEYHFPIAADKLITADKEQMEQVIINLLKNAVESCEEKAELMEKEFSACRYAKQIKCTVGICNDEKSGDEKLYIDVEDNGMGILPSVQEQVFTPFFTTKNHGSGIGLSLSKQIIVNHGGTISISSEKNEGCRIRCKIPVRSFV